MRLFLFSLFIASGFYLSSCKKPVLKDAALAPDDELNARFTDTLTIRAFTYREDSLSVKNATIKILGAMDDPVFGKTFAGFYLQFLLPEIPLNLGDEPRLDSIVLALRYYEKYGDVTVPQLVRIFEMTEGIDQNAEYFSNKTFSVNPSFVGEIQNFAPNTEDSLLLPEGKVPPQMRVKLNDGIGERIINAAGNLQTQENFHDLLKGLYVTVDTNVLGKGLIHFNPFSLFSNLTLYYHNSENDSLTKDFAINIDINSLGLTNVNGTVNHIKHNYQGSFVQPFINSQNPGGDSLIFIQPLAGLNVKFSIPHLGNLENVLVNKAQLVVTQVNDPAGTNNSFSTPPSLSLRPSDSEGFPDQSIIISSGGEKLSIINNESTEVSRYDLDYSGYAQSTLKRHEDFGIFILPLTRQNISNRLILGGGNHSSYRMKLNLTYTVIN